MILAWLSPFKPGIANVDKLWAYIYCVYGGRGVLVKIEILW